MIPREELERREVETLASFAATSGQSVGRIHPEKEPPYRTAFQRDRDRVIHSGAFRRLQYKTQVFVNHVGDYFRTRLTHSTEAAQVSRTVARALGLNEDLSEVIALAHDLGHTPFGHSGQDALHECMKEHGGFEHNLQSVRVVTKLEKRHPGFPGLNLTFETLESIRKHTIREDLPLEEEYRPEWSPLLEGQVVDIADSIAYDAHDIDDSIKAGLLEEDALQELPLWQESQEAALSRYPGLTGKLLILQSVRALINTEVTDLVKMTLENVKRLGIDSIEAVRAAKEPIVTFSPQLEQKKLKLQRFLRQNVYEHHRVIAMQEKSKKFLREIFASYVGNPMQLPPKYQKWAEEVGLERSVCDYIAGMTDRYAQEQYRKLFLPFENVL